MNSSQADAQQQNQPIAVTPGEPAGIGPDLAVMLAHRQFDYPFVIISDPQVLATRAKLLGVNLQIRNWQPGTPIQTRNPGELDLLAYPTRHPVRPGSLDSRNADFVLQTLAAANDGCMNRTFSAVVTGPVQKSILNNETVNFSGHTEYFAERSQTAKVVMMLATDNLRVALATTHLPLKDVPTAITRQSLEELITILLTEMRHKFFIPQPRILVCGLNPHAGEGGHLGSEELEVIAPVIKQFQSSGALVEGPFPADTVFTPPFLARADVVLAMYHDQGLPVLKHSGFGNAVNITLGLPYIRTSVDHGTALELAASGKAHDGSLMAAMQQAHNLVCAKQSLAQTPYGTDANDMPAP